MTCPLLPLFRTVRALGCIALAIGFLLAPVRSALAENITYPPGNGPLQNIPHSGGSFYNNSVAPTGSDSGKSGSRTGNIITVTYSSSIPDYVFGAVNTVDSAAITNNQVTITGNAIIGNVGLLGDVYGGYAQSNTTSTMANTNTVTISGSSSVGDRIYGGYAYSYAMTATAEGNKVFFEDVAAGGFIYGGSAWSFNGLATVQSNTVTINGGTLTSDVYGGFVKSNNGEAMTKGNEVFITSGSIDHSVYGGYAQGDIFGMGTATATDNMVTINGGTIDYDVYGGFAYTGTVVAAATATGNIVTISGGTISKDVYGGFAYTGNAGAAATATGNTVTISGSPDLSASNLYGGFTYGSGTGEARSGNTLNLHSPITVEGVGNFENWNFYLPATMGNGATMLIVTDSSSTGVSLDSGAKVNVGIDGASSPLKAGDTVNLIKVMTGVISGSLDNTTVTGQGMGVTLLYEFDLLVDTNNGLLTATVTSADPQVNEQAKALSEGFLAGPALANVGANFVAGKGMAWAMDAVGQNGADNSDNDNFGNGFGVFGGIEGGSSRYQTGSHVDMKSVSLLAGLAWGADLAPGRLTLGGFLEYGTGSYDTYNSFTNLASVRGDGNTHNFGGGVLGRFDAKGEDYAGLYTEGSFRVGRLHNEYRNNDLLFMGQRAEYNSDSTYFGFHLGGGYILNFSHKSSLDLYGKYFWTRVQGDSVRLSTGDPVKFDNVDSSRLRLGGRLAYTANEYVSPYLGAAYEHEFDGKARATTNGFAISAPSMRGGTGIGELGLTIKPSPSLPLSFDLGVQGYVGKRQGVTGNLQIRYEF